MPKVLAVIPARMQSSRFPGKPLAPLLDRSMIEHVYRRTMLANVLDQVVIATCDQEIMEEGKRFGAPTVLTSPYHERCTERVAEAAQNISCDVVVEVQGDEPLLHPSMIEDVVKPLLKDSSLSCCNLMSALKPSSPEWKSSEVVKVVYAKDFSALYMSRSAIPSNYRGVLAPIAKQLGIIAFRKDCLHRYTQLPPTPLERAESIDMLRLLENNIPIKMAYTAIDSMGVDTPEQLKKAAELMSRDPVYLSYSKLKITA